MNAYINLRNILSCSGARAGSELRDLEARAKLGAGCLTSLPQQVGGVVENEKRRETVFALQTTWLNHYESF